MWLQLALSWKFYHAPLAGIVCMNRELHHADSLGVLGTCIQMLIAAFPDVVREALVIPDR